jgi:hypothetical protein
MAWTMCLLLVLLSAAASVVASMEYIKQGPSTTCDDDKKKILCLPVEYSKFDLPYRNDFNLIDIGE